MAQENNQSNNNSSERHTIPMANIISSIRGILTEGEAPPERAENNFDPIEELKRSASASNGPDIMDLAAFTDSGPQEQPMTLDNNEAPQDELILGPTDDDVMDLGGGQNDDAMILGDANTIERAHQNTQNTMAEPEPMPEPADKNTQEPQVMVEEVPEQMPEPEPEPMAEPAPETMDAPAPEPMGQNEPEPIAETMGEQLPQTIDGPEPKTETAMNKANQENIVNQAMVSENIPNPMQEAQKPLEDEEDVTSILQNIPPQEEPEQKPRFVIKTAPAITPLRPVAPAKPAFPSAGGQLIEVNQTISLNDMRNNEAVVKNIAKNPFADIPKAITISRTRPVTLQETAPMPEHTPPSDNTDSYMNTNTMEQADQGFAQLQEVMKKQQQNPPSPALTPLPIGNGAVTLEQMVRESIKPMLSGWINDNLPIMVKDIITTEIQKITKKYQ